MPPAPLHILILEDNPADAVLMVRALRQRGVECIWQRVETRAEYLAHLGPPYEVILADYNLPEFTAPQALELLRERGWDIPFIVVTGIVDEEAVVACMKEGTADYLLKDRLARLAPAVQSALEQKRLRDEKRQTEAALRASEQRFRALIENSSDAVALIAADSILLYVSPSGSRMFGRPWGERIGRDVFELMHPEDLPAIKDRFARLLREPHTTVTVQFRYQHKDDSWRRVEAVGQNLLTEPSVRAMVVNYRDITEQKEAEKALRKSEERYRSLCENALESVFRSTPTGRFTDVNPALVRMLGYDSAAELFALQLPDDLYVDPAQREQLQLTHNPLGKIEGAELLWKKKNGEPIVVMMYAKADRDARGNILAYEGMVLDITARKRTEAAVQAEAQIAAALAQAGQALIATLDTPVILHHLCELTTTVLGCDCSTTLLRQPENDAYAVVANHGHPPEQWKTLRTLKLPREGRQTLRRESANPEDRQNIP